MLAGEEAPDAFRPKTEANHDALPCNIMQNFQSSSSWAHSSCNPKVFVIFRHLFRD